MQSVGKRKARGNAIGAHQYASRLATLCALALIVAAAAMRPGIARAGQPFTTTCAGTDVNKNLYTDKTEVYMGGGPQSPACTNTGAGLSDGDYYFQVTDPSGATLLSTDPLKCRVVTVSGGVITAYNPGAGCAAGANVACPALGATPHNVGTGPCVADFPNQKTVELFPFADTPNGGSVYKAWIMPKGSLPGSCNPALIDPGSCGGSDHGFINSASNTDNFRVKTTTPPVEQVGEIDITKFCDVDADGTIDSADFAEPLSGWQMGLSPSGTCTNGGVTDSLGSTSCANLDPDTYTVSETLKSGFAQTATCVDGFCGTCSVTTTTACNNLGDCPAGETCNLTGGPSSASVVVAGGDVHDVTFGNVGLSSISGTKFNDLNANTTQEKPAEKGLAGVVVNLTGTEQTGNCSVTTAQRCSTDDECPTNETCTLTTVSQCAVTGSDGSYSFSNLLPGSYVVTEAPPANTISTTGTSCNELLEPDPTDCSGDNATCNFGNVCLGKGGGLTLGFWSNKNGQGLLTKQDLCFLNTLNLVNATGATFDPVAGCPNPSTTQFNNGKTSLRNWLLSATATNMSYMLSAQLAAMELNVRHNFVDPNAVIYAFFGGNALPGGCVVTGLSNTGFIKIGDLMTDANNKLGNDGFTPAGDSNRACWQFDKNALDSANNNLNFSVACPSNFGGTCP